MIAHLRGKLLAKSPQSVIVEAAAASDKTTSQY